jgi:hypothetical protein
MGWKRSRYDATTLYDIDHSALNPVPDPNRSMHPSDIALLAPVKPLGANGLDEKPPVPSEVSWMRTSNLFTRKGAARRREAAEAKNK